jgi:hypothetical protein
MNKYQTELEYLNDEAMFKSMETLSEVDSMKTAVTLSETVAKALVKQAGLPRSKVKYAVLEIRFKDRPYVAVGVSLNNALVLIRATDLESSKCYVPSTFYAVMSYMNGDEEVSMVVPIAGSDPDIIMNTGDPMFDDATVQAISIDYNDGPGIPVPRNVPVKMKAAKSSKGASK